MNTQELRKLADACFPGLVATALRECADKIDQLQADAARYQWLTPKLLCADFSYGEDALCALVFEIPKTMRVSANLNATIDAAMKEQP